jgi:hypothetical protein
MHIYDNFRWIVLELDTFRIKFVEIIKKTHFIFNYFFRELCLLWYNVEGTVHSQIGRRSQWNTAEEICDVHAMPDN